MLGFLLSNNRRRRTHGSRGRRGYYADPPADGKRGEDLPPRRLQTHRRRPPGALFATFRLSSPQSWANLPPSGRRGPGTSSSKREFQPASSKTPVPSRSPTLARLEESLDVSAAPKPRRRFMFP